MTLDALLLFVPGCFALNMAPGPNNLLSVSYATRYGFWVASLAGVGRLLAFVLMIAIAAAGVSSVMHSFSTLFYAIKVCGALYLLYLAFQLWRASPTPVSSVQVAGRQSIRSLARQEFFVGAGNPKAILIVTAFIPQFVDVARPVGPQFALLGVLFLALEWLAIAAYAFMGCYLKTWFSRPERLRIFNRTCAILLGSAGILLLLARGN
jgi:Putative threonine efflux protein